MAQVRWSCVLGSRFRCKTAPEKPASQKARENLGNPTTKPAKASPENLPAALQNPESIPPQTRHDFQNPTEKNLRYQNQNPDRGFAFESLTGRRISRDGRESRRLFRPESASSAGCAARSAKQPADVYPPPRCRGREASATTNDYTVSTYLPLSAMVDKNYLILLAFISSITSIASLATLEIPTCSPSPGTRPSYSPVRGKSHATTSPACAVATACPARKGSIR